MRNERELFPGALELMVLRTLEQRPLHGYALAQHIKTASDDLLQVEEGSLYPALQRMLKEGWLKARWEVSATKRRVRVYTLTATGKKRLQSEVRKFERMVEGIQRVLAVQTS